MKEYLEQVRQFYMRLWAFHLKNVMECLKNSDLDSALSQMATESMQLGEQYRNTPLEDWTCQMIIDSTNEIERIIKKNDH